MDHWVQVPPPPLTLPAVRRAAASGTSTVGPLMLEYRLCRRPALHSLVPSQGLSSSDDLAQACPQPGRSSRATVLRGCAARTSLADIHYITVFLFSPLCGYSANLL